jgi:hypothetical protein
MACSYAWRYPGEALARPDELLVPERRVVLGVAS